MCFSVICKPLFPGFPSQTWKMFTLLQRKREKGFQFTFEIHGHYSLHNINKGFHNYHTIAYTKSHCFVNCCWLFYRSNKGHREQVCELLHSHRAQYVIIALVVIDMIIVIAELLVDLKAIEGKRHHWYHFQAVFRIILLYEAQ